MQLSANIYDADGKNLIGVCISSLFIQSSHSFASLSEVYQHPEASSMTSMMAKPRFKEMRICFLSDEIGVIPCPEARCNRSPIVLVENKLGVESWCIKFLLPYVHNKLLLYRQRKHWLDREGEPFRDETMSDRKQKNVSI